MKQHLEQTRLFKELFSEFNARYDSLSEALNDIGSPDHDASTDAATLNKYFNLCAEEFLYFQAGYLDADVWQAWCRGIRTFALKPEIYDLWIEELAVQSYYGFTPAVLEEIRRMPFTT